jgi:hypothetical protein
MNSKTFALTQQKHSNPLRQVSEKFHPPAINLGKVSQPWFQDPSLSSQNLLGKFPLIEFIQYHQSW